jgi:hypothetical protein
MWLCQYIPDFIRGGFTLITALLGLYIAAMLALRGYFRQREHELVRDRYLIGSIDVVAAELDKAMASFRHNHSRCLKLFQLFRDLDLDFNLEELSKGFSDYTISLPMIAHHRLGDLIGTQLIWNLYQAAVAFVVTANGKMDDLLEVIRLKIDRNRVDASSREIFEDALKALDELDTKSQRYAVLMRALHKIGQMLEQERMTFKRATRFSRRPDLKKLLAELERELMDELDVSEPDKPPAAPPPMKANVA